MRSEAHIGIIGDCDDSKPSHAVTNIAIYHTAEYLGIICAIEWVPTRSLLTPARQLKLKQFDGIWASPGSPYESMEGAITGIRAVREADIPFTGT
jgi:CTP synthase (UTP-ammonia lyase)